MGILSCMIYDSCGSAMLIIGELPLDVVTSSSNAPSSSERVIVCWSGGVLDIFSLASMCLV